VAVGILLTASCGLYTPDGGREAGETPDSAVGAIQRFRSLADAFVAWHYSTRPTRATADGIHEQDGHLGQFSREYFEARASVLRDYLRRTSFEDPAGLDDESYYDLLVLRSAIQSMLVEVDRIRPWERNPGYYRDAISEGLYPLATRSFSPLVRRMEAAAERMSEIPAVLGHAKANLANPPRIYTEMAIEEFGGTHAFIKNDLPAAFQDVKDESIRKRFAESHKLALASIEHFVDWLRKDLLPRSSGDFALGADTYRFLLMFREGVDAPLEDLLQRGRELLARTQEEMKRICGDRPVRTVLRESAKEHPPADRLLADTQALLDGLKQWAAGVVDVPSDAVCAVQETPAFRRTLSFASMELPGPFERIAREAFYSITLPDPSWTPERQEQHLSFFNRHTLPLISVHEAFPGHYTQFLAVRNCRSIVRKAFGSSAFSEGWAHYCEQLYVDEMSNAPPELRLHQLSMALLRICRYLAGIQMHAKGMTYEQAVELFVNEGYLERVNAEREARRGTVDPMYLVYTLGKMEILKLRDEYRARTGRSLREFHNELLRHGYPPLPVVRKILLGER
jgi:uncharacterized protein (DUF885 family)